MPAPSSSTRPRGGGEQLAPHLAQPGPLCAGRHPVVEAGEDRVLAHARIDPGFSGRRRGRDCMRPRKVKERGSDSHEERRSDADIRNAHQPDLRGSPDPEEQPEPGTGGQQGGRAARGQGQGAVGDARAVRLHHDRRGARREDDGQGLGRARLARHDEQPDARGDPRRGVRGAPFEGSRRRWGRARARDRPGSRPVSPGAGAALRARATRESPRRRAASRLGRRTSTRWSPPLATRRSTWSSSARRRRWSRGWSTRSRRRASPPSGRAREAARLEGSKLHAKELMAEAGVPTASHAVVRSREEALGEIAGGSYPGGAQGRRPGGRQGRDHRHHGGGGPRGGRSLLRGAAFRRHRGRDRGVPRGRGALAARPLRRRERPAAGPGAGLQAHPRRRRGTQHRRHGELFARPGLRPRARPSESPTSCTARWSTR